MSFEGCFKYSYANHVGPKIDFQRKAFDVIDV